MKNRASKILEALIQEERVEVTSLSGLLGVSQVTVRKDLDELEKQGIIIREHGYAILRNTDNMNGRIAYHYDEKILIAKKASELVKDGDTIMIESGSCCALFANELVRTRKDLTVITNSAFIAEYLRKNATFQVILLGGIYQAESQVTVGPMIAQCAENFMVDNFFVGTDGYSAKSGFTNCDQMRAQAVRDMAKQAERVIFITESAKFLKHGIVPLKLVDTDLKISVVTDSNISEDMVRQLQLRNINVITTQAAKNP